MKCVCQGQVNIIVRGLQYPQRFRLGLALRSHQEYPENESEMEHSILCVYHNSQLRLSPLSLPSLPALQRFPIDASHSIAFNSCFPHYDLLYHQVFHLVQQHPLYPAHPAIRC